jgi:NAD(P)-dependent dehydrogenase (short-subunit alcohol dehydrogenase family)
MTLCLVGDDLLVMLVIPSMLLLSRCYFSGVECVLAAADPLFSTFHAERELFWKPPWQHLVPNTRSEIQLLMEFVYLNTGVCRSLHMINKFSKQYFVGLSLLITREKFMSGRIMLALLPLLKLFTSGGARIVNASSLASELKRMPNEKLRNDLSNIDIWDEDRIQAVLNTFLEDLRSGRLEEAGWPVMLPAYSLSKMVINLYTRIIARRYPEMRINCVRPGFVTTDISWNLGVLTPKQGARGPVMLALLPDDGPTGWYRDEMGDKMGSLLFFKMVKYSSLVEGFCGVQFSFPNIQLCKSWSQELATNTESHLLPEMLEAANGYICHELHLMLTSIGVTHMIDCVKYLIGVIDLLTPWDPGIVVFNLKFLMLWLEGKPNLKKGGMSVLMRWKTVWWLMAGRVRLVCII